MTMKVTKEKAQEIMGKNFFGIEDAVKHFGIKPTEEDLKTLSEIPYLEKVLRECRDTHILVAIFPISIIEIREIVNSKLFKDDWYDDEEFAKEKGKTCWKLIRKAPVPKTTSKDWKYQLRLIGRYEEVPTARNVVYIIMGCYLEHGERLLENVYVRTSSTDWNRVRILIGRFDSGGLDVRSFWDDFCVSDFGLAGARKS